MNKRPRRKYCQIKTRTHLPDLTKRDNVNNKKIWPKIEIIFSCKDVINIWIFIFEASSIYLYKQIRYNKFKTSLTNEYSWTWHCFLYCPASLFTDNVLNTLLAICLNEFWCVLMLLVVVKGKCELQMMSK